MILSESLEHLLFIITYFTEGLRKLNEIAFAKFVAQSLAHSKHSVRVGYHDHYGFGNIFITVKKSY